MSSLKGMLTLNQLQEMVENETVDTVLVVFNDMYGRLMGKRFDGDFFLQEAVLTGIRRIKAAENVHERGLAGAGRSHDGYEVTFADLQVDVVECVNYRVTHVKVAA